MNGLMLYRQYLENIRSCILNFELDSLESKKYLDILSRMNEIEDMSYIDVILKNAGLDLSFIGDNSFLETPVVLKSKISEVFTIDDIEDDEMQDAVSDYLGSFVAHEDSVMEKIDSILGENGIPEISSEYFPASSEGIMGVEELLESHKDTLGALFGGLSSLTKSIEENKTEDTEDEFSEEEFEDLDDSEVVDTEETNIEEEKEETQIENIEEKSEEDIDFYLVDDVELQTKIDDLKSEIDYNEIEENLDLDKEEIEEDISENKKSKTFDTSFLDDDFVEKEQEDIENTENTEETEDVESDIENDSVDEDSISDKDFSMFLDETENTENIEDLDEELEEDNFEDLDDFDSDELDNEVSSMYSLNEEEDIEPTDGSLFREATDYFLNGGKRINRNEPKENLKELYKSKERMVNDPNFSNADDNFAKLILAIGDGAMNLPNITADLFKKIKGSSKKMYDNMVVEDDNDEE